MDSKTEPSSDQPKEKPTRWLKIFRWSIAFAVAIALFVTIQNAAEKLQEHQFDLQSVRWSQIILAIAVYAVAMLLSCVFWRSVLVALGGLPTWNNAIRAFFFSQLGKYVPGKAMVVVIRTDLVRDKNTDTVAAAASVFAETLTWIFVGSVIACVLMFTEFQEHTRLKWIAGTFALVAGIVTFPPIFRILAGKLGKRDLGQFAGLGMSTMAFGWLILTFGWCLNGLSLWLVLGSFPDVALDFADYRLALACVSLGTVAGFASLLPGGLGVRELVMIPLLGPRFGPAIAIIAAILIRLVWLFSELLCGGIIYLLKNDRRNIEPTNSKT